MTDYNERVGKAYQKISTWFLTSAFGMFLACWNFLGRIDDGQNVLINEFWYDITLLLGLVFLVWSFVILIGYPLVRKERGRVPFEISLVLFLVILFFILLFFIIIDFIGFGIFRWFSI